MALEQHDIDTDVMDMPEDRSLASIQRDLDGLPDAIASQTRDLFAARRRLASWLGGLREDSAGWRGLIDGDEFRELGTIEEATVTRLEGIKARILADRDRLRDLPYRPNLPADQVAAAEAKATSLATRLPGMTAAQVAREIRGATLFGDTVSMAAWALLAPNIEARFPASQRVRDNAGRDVTPATLFGSLLRQCVDRTGDRQAAETREQLDARLMEVTQAITEIAHRRNAHQPGSMGGPLLQTQFGGGSIEQRQRARQYDPQAVAVRVGR